MMESKLIMKSMETLMPKIKINKSLYIPMLDTVLTRENVGSLPAFTEQQRTEGGSAWKKQNDLL
jgi:acetyl esterase/lipase